MGYFSRQNGWTAIILMFSVLMLWLWMTPDQNRAKEMHLKMMSMTTAAFQEAIVFAHLRYHANSTTMGDQLDLIELAGHKLDFNRYGFPMGVSHDEFSIKLPITQKDCRDLWNTLLAPMRPMIEPDDYATLEVKIQDDKCVFKSLSFEEHQIIYHPQSGLVSLKVF